MEAFISSMIWAGLAAKRPPHMVFVMTVLAWARLALTRLELSGKT
jgi:hypothetical protein